MKDNSEHRTPQEILHKHLYEEPNYNRDRHLDEINAMKEYADQETKNLKSIIAERDKEIEELKATIKDLIPIADITFKSMARHEIIHTPNETRKEKVESIISHAKALILPLSPRHPEQPPQLSTP